MLFANDGYINLYFLGGLSCFPKLISLFPDHGHGLMTVMGPLNWILAEKDHSAVWTKFGQFLSTWGSFFADLGSFLGHQGLNHEFSRVCHDTCRRSTMISRGLMAETMSFSGVRRETWWHGTKISRSLEGSNCETHQESHDMEEWNCNNFVTCHHISKYVRQFHGCRKICSSKLWIFRDELFWCHEFGLWCHDNLFSGHTSCFRVAVLILDVAAMITCLFLKHLNLTFILWLSTASV